MSSSCFWGFRFGLLFLAITVPLSFQPLANPQPTLAQTVRSKQKSIEANILYVDPKTGNDRTGMGTARSPLKTITHALKVAPAKTVILLAPGTYSASGGEKFPIIVKKEVVIQGDPRTKGKNVIIRGNGYYLSPTAAGQNVTIVASHQAEGIIGITAIDPHKRGHGLWIESASPEVTYNTFTLNGNSGVSINGNSAPTIANNNFYSNGGNGVLIYGTSKPVVRDNVFEKTGFGVSALQKTNSLLKGNRIGGNRIGVILEGNAQVTLRNNVIENSTENGLVAISQSRADLGTLQEPGGNIFKGNRLLDIQNLTLNGQVITAFGNQLSKGTKGKVELGERVASQEVPPSSPLPVSSSSSPPKKKPTPVFRGSDNSQSSPSSNPSKLPVPNAPISTSNSGKTVPGSKIPTGEFYRVIVETTSADEEEAVRLLYPDAFTTLYQGQSVLQVGIFSTRENARKILQSLKDIGLKGAVLTR